MRATTNGSIADKIWEESPFTTTSDKLLGSVPKDSNVKLPSLRCKPTFPINGDEVEQANADIPPLKLFESLGKWEIFFRSKERELEFRCELQVELEREGVGLEAFGRNFLLIGCVRVMNGFDAILFGEVKLSFE